MNINRSLVAIGTTIVFGVGFLSNLQGSAEFFIKIASIFNSKNEYKISVIEARLLPARPSLKLKTDMDNDAFIILEIRNYGSNPIMLTSAKAELINSHNISTSGAYGPNTCVLADDPNRNNEPITINPGQTKWVGVAQALRFNDLMEWFSRQELESLFLHEIAPHMPFTIAESSYVDILNKRLSILYGKESAVKVTYTVNLNEGTKSFTIPFTRGKDIFSRDGNFQHDWMIAHLIEPSVVPTVNLSHPECDIDKIIHFPGYKNE
ncbi:hypothetical protein [Yersinia frederiksenii]|uniref:hypothetical protein n=1 Tax=Yersinia frederiksenii TaxID=29484 RepID=UPI0005E47319|nr:hypothetical protein [Yersinia frederiksenii]CQJ03922.1 Uncharacterised protein [Yersinia frederiksenii]